MTKDQYIKLGGKFPSFADFLRFECEDYSEDDIEITLDCLEIGLPLPAEVLYDYHVFMNKYFNCCYKL